MKKTRQSSNIQDERTSPSRIKQDRLKSSLDAAREAGNNALRNYYAGTGQISKAQRSNAKALGMESQTTKLQNDANKLEARKRTRFTKATDRQVMTSLFGRKS